MTILSPALIWGRFNRLPSGVMASIRFRALDGLRIDISDCLYLDIDLFTMQVVLRFLNACFEVQASIGLAIVLHELYF